MSASKLDAFIKEQIADAKAKNLLFSVHLKASMMKVSDPVIFGHFVKNFFAEVFEEFESELKSVNVSENNGLKDLFARILNLPQATQEKIKAKFDDIYATRPNLAMVNSAAGVTNLHVPSDIIIDASMPAMIKNGGKMWDKDGVLCETKAVIPDKTYAVVYEASIADIKANGALDPAKIGSVSNVGLMAKKAEEYGSHDKTFVMSEAGEACVLNEKGEILFKFELEKGDIFRMTQVKDIAVRNWVELALKRAKITGQKAIFWLDENRAHDREILKKVKAQLASSDASGLDIEILSPAVACKKSLEIIRRGEDCISVTGNVLRDYLTDLFPILELETSAKMLSVVPLLEGGSIFETGAGGSAPRLAEQLLEQNHLSWDSLGEFLALGASLEQLAGFKQSPEAQILADTLNAAVERYLKENKVPRFEALQLDTRTSHFYIALYWASELAASGTQLGDKFKLVAQNLAQNEIIVLHLQGSHGPAYYARYPSEFRKFTPTCDTSELSSCDSDSIVNTYDNTLLFTDFFVGEVIKAVKDVGGDKSAVWYFSDHGESLGENGIYLHGMPYAIAPETQKHIPMMAYASDEATLARLRAQKDEAVSHDNVFSSLLGFFGVETKEYDKKLDIFK